MPLKDRLRQAEIARLTGDDSPQGMALVAWADARLELKDFNPNERRDRQGKWTNSGSHLSETELIRNYATMHGRPPSIAQVERLRGKRPRGKQPTSDDLREVADFWPVEPVKAKQLYAAARRTGLDHESALVQVARRFGPPRAPKRA